VRVILDTNVFVSGVFFTGPPARILEAWSAGRLSLVISPDILDEYYRVGVRLAERYPEVDLNPAIALLAVEAEIVEASKLAQPVCKDPDDDKFLACAKSAGVSVIVSGDKHLLDVSGWESIDVLKPHPFLDHYLKANS
jgi:putative PIN family toxin of toxin-antitoxin system